VNSAHFVVYFEGDKVSRIERLDLPEPPGKGRPEKWRKEQKPAEVAPDSGAAPSTAAQPEQDAQPGQDAPPPADD
jgi:hypothetical protein